MIFDYLPPGLFQEIRVSGRCEFTGISPGPAAVRPRKPGGLRRPQPPDMREYGTWADWLGVPRHTFSAVFGAVIALGIDYRVAFQYFRPDFSLDAERTLRADAGQPEWFGEDDLYRDVRPSMTALREMGVWVGVAGNQTSRAGDLLRSLALPADLVATSGIGRE